MRKGLVEKRLMYSPSMRGWRAASAALPLLAALNLASAQEAPAIEPATAAEPYPNSVEVESAPQPDQTGPSARVAGGNRFVEEIVVTAQKREENLQDVPISVQALSADLLDAKGIENPADLQKTAPSLNYTTTAGYSLIYLRGVGSDAFFMADPSVALYIDGIYFPFAQGLAQSFGALERIEVLKGPQGTLFGRNAVGGAINIITKSPTDHFETSVQTSYGSYDQFRLRAHTNIPIADTLSVSASAFYSTEDSYYHGTSNGQPLLPEVSKGVRLKAKWKPNETFDFTGAGFLLKQSGTASFFALNSNPSPILGAAIQPNTSYTGTLDAPVYDNIDNRVLYGQANVYLDPFDIRLLASNQNINVSFGYDYDGSNVPLVGFEAKKQYADVQSAELQVLSNNTSWGSEWLKWIAGVYAFQSRQGFDPVILRLLDLNLVGGLPINLPVAPELLAALGQAAALGAVPNGGFTLTALIDTKSIAGFGQATVNFTDYLALTVGARYQAEKRTAVESKSELETIDGSVFPIPLCDAVHGGDIVHCKHAGAPLSDTTYSLKPKVSLEFRPYDHVLTYLTYQQALKSGTINVLTLYDPPDFVKPEELNAYEVGFKSTLFDGLMTFNAAAFYYDIKNLQVQFVSVLQGGAVSFENAKGARVQGADFDGLLVIAPSLIDGLVLTFGGAYLDGEYTDYENARGYSQTTGLGFTNGNYNGNDTVRTPKVSGTLGLSKTWSMDSGSFELAGDTYYNSGFFFSPQNEPASRQDAYEIFNARASYMYSPWGLRVTVYGNNVTSKKYKLGQFLQDFGTLDYLSQPATYGMRLNWDF